MRSLQHVLWRGAIALGLFLGSSAGILALPHPASSPCAAVAMTPAMTAGIRPYDSAPRHRC
jgi:hypothetical protein